MQGFRRSRFLRHVALPLTLVAWLSGCYKWTRPGMPLEQALSVGFIVALASFNSSFGQQ